MSSNNGNEDAIISVSGTAMLGIIIAVIAVIALGILLVVAGCCNSRFNSQHQTQFGFWECIWVRDCFGCVKPQMIETSKQQRIQSQMDFQQRQGIQMQQMQQPNYQQHMGQTVSVTTTTAGYPTNGHTVVVMAQPVAPPGAVPPAINPAYGHCGPSANSPSGGYGGPPPQPYDPQQQQPQYVSNNNAYI